MVFVEITNPSMKGAIEGVRSREIEENELQSATRPIAIRAIPGYWSARAQHSDATLPAARPRPSARSTCLPFCWPKAST
eukprot:3229578-Alexandrium_andersonii.AAC.1